MRFTAACSFARSSGEVLRDAAAGGEDRRAHVRVERGIQMFVRRLPRVEQIGGLHMDVVEDVRHVAAGDDGQGSRRRCKRIGCAHRCRSFKGVGGAGLHGELRDLLQLALVEELEVFLAQPADGIPVTVPNHHRHGNQVHPSAERRGSFAGDYFRLRPGSGRLRPGQGGRR